MTEPAPIEEIEVIKPELWIDISQQVQTEINNALHEKGDDLTVMTKDGLILSETDRNRVQKVKTALNLAASQMVTDRIIARKDPSSFFGTVDFRTSDGRSVIGILTKRGIGEMEYNKARAEGLEKAVKILETFEQPPIPVFTSKDRPTL